MRNTLARGNIGAHRPQTFAACPRFAANLSFLYPEVPFLDRFAAAAQDGFRAVEFGFGYDFAAQDLAARLSAHGLEQVLINAPPGDLAAGERGLAALPGPAGIRGQRRHSACLRAGPCLPARARHGRRAAQPVDSAQRTRHRATFVRNLRVAARAAAEQGVTVTIEPINARDVPGYFLTTQADAHQSATRWARRT